MPSSLEPGPSHANTRYFSPSDVFTVLYGTSTARLVSMDEGGSFTTAQLRTADRVNSGKFRTSLKTVRAVLNKNRVQSRATTRILACCKNLRVR